MRDDRERLADILEAAERIAVRVARGRRHFGVDEDAQLAMVRLVEIIGEAWGNFSVELRQRYPAVPWRAAAGMRNRVIHGYFDIDIEVVWATAERDVPTLARSVQTIVNELEGESAGGEGRP